MALARSIHVGDVRGYESLTVAYVRRRGEIDICAWSEGMVTLTRPLGAFLRDLGITVEDCQRALAKEQTS